MLLVVLFYALCCSCVLMATLLGVKWRFGCGCLLMLERSDSGIRCCVVHCMNLLGVLTY